METENSIREHDRWISADRVIVHKSDANCRYPQIARTRKGDLLLSVLVGHPELAKSLMSKNIKISIDALEKEGK